MRRVPLLASAAAVLAAAFGISTHFITAATAGSGEPTEQGESPRAKSGGDMSGMGEGASEAPSAQPGSAAGGAAGGAGAGGAPAAPESAAVPPQPQFKELTEAPPPVLAPAVQKILDAHPKEDIVVCLAGCDTTKVVYQQPAIPRPAPKVTDDKSANAAPAAPAAASSPAVTPAAAAPAAAAPPAADMDKDKAASAHPADAKVEKKAEGKSELVPTAAAPSAPAAASPASVPAEQPGK